MTTPTESDPHSNSPADHAPEPPSAEPPSSEPHTLSPDAAVSLNNKSFGPTTMRNYLPEPEDNFYREAVLRILPFCGNEYATSDFHAAVGMLNKDLNLRLDATEERALAIRLTGLAQAYRFDGDLHIPAELGENSAVHSCHTAILATEIFRRAGLLSQERQSPEAIAMRVEITLACLDHDMGEILGEFNSLAQRVANEDLAEDPDLERKIFKATVELAYKAVHEGREDHFYQALKALRDAAGIVDRGARSDYSLDEILEEHSVEIPPEVQGYVDMHLAFFDMAELKDPENSSRSSLFRGYAVKVIEHIQGTRHLNRFAMKEEGFSGQNYFYETPTETNRTSAEEQREDPRYSLSIPASLTPSYRIRGGFKYLESGLGELFELAESAEELALAKALRDATYQTVMEWLQVMPEHFDRREDRIDPLVTEVMAELSDMTLTPVRKEDRVGFAEKVLRREKESQKQSFNQLAMSSAKLGVIESRDRLIALYKKAVESDYKPKPGEILALSDELPDELQGFTEQ